MTKNEITHVLTWTWLKYTIHKQIRVISFLCLMISYHLFVIVKPHGPYFDAEALHVVGLNSIFSLQKTTKKSCWNGRTGGRNVAAPVPCFSEARRLWRFGPGSDWGLRELAFCLIHLLMGLLIYLFGLIAIVTMLWHYEIYV